MKASYNYTGRKRLDNSAFDIELHEAAAGPSEFEVALHYDAITGMPENPVAWVEAYRGPRVMRFRLRPPATTGNPERFALEQFAAGEPLLFRIKVVDESDSKHPIKGWRDRIRPVVYSASGQKKRSILPVYPCDLGHIAWALDWEDTSRPVLQVNSRISEARDISSIVKNDPDFAILVFPKVISEVLTRLLREDADSEEDGQENEWLQFGANLTGREFEGSEEDEEDNNRLIDNWVTDAVQSFGRSMELVSRYNRFKAGESQ
jgi:hypothetical protein